MPRIEQYSRKLGRCGMPQGKICIYVNECAHLHPSPTLFLRRLWQTSTIRHPELSPRRTGPAAAEDNAGQLLYIHFKFNDSTSFL